MKLEDIKVGMKVRLISKEGGISYPAIEEFYKDNDDCCSNFFEKNGYGFVVKVDDTVLVGCDKCSTGWEFLPEDLETYDVILTDNTGKNFSTVLGKVAKVVDVSEVDSFRNGDIVVILEEDRAPYCILKEHYNHELTYKENLESPKSLALHGSEIEILTGEMCINKKSLDEATIEELEQRLKELKDDKRNKAQELANQAAELLTQVKTMGFEYCSSELIGYGEVKVNIEIL